MEHCSLTIKLSRPTNFFFGGGGSMQIFNVWSSSQQWKPVKA